MQVVHLRVNDSTTNKPTPVRLRLATPDGKYLPPLGRPAKFPAGWGQQVGGSVLLDGKEYCYIDGACEVLLPDGPIHVEISKGPEYAPIQHVVERKPGQLALRFTIERKFNMNAEGWYSGDTSVFFLSPKAAWLEGAAEGLNVVNLLGMEWTENRKYVHQSNVIEFSGQEPAYEKDGTMVVVNTMNRGDKLGGLILLNCHRTVFPLRLEQQGFEKYTPLDWCNQCHRKGGLVVWPEYGAYTQANEACLSLRQIDALEVSRSVHGSSTTLGWEQVHLGQRVSLVGGSGKGNNQTVTGYMRTYVHIDREQPFCYAAWIEGIRAGRTFYTRGPLISFKVNGRQPGDTVPAEELSRPVQIEARASGLRPQDELVVYYDDMAERYSHLDFRTMADAAGNAAVSLEREFRIGDALTAACNHTDPETRDRNPALAATSPIYLGGLRMPHKNSIEHELNVVQLNRNAIERDFGGYARLPALLELLQRAERDLEARLQ